MRNKKPHKIIKYFKNEIWKPIPNSNYEASSRGRIRRIYILNTNTKNKSGYYKASYTRYNTFISRLVHQLVAEAFLGKKPAGLFVNHKDGIKANNDPKNLEYVTRKQNGEHASKLGLYRSGENHPKSKLSSRERKGLKRDAATGKYTYKELGKIYLVSRSTAHKIATGRKYGGK